ncbi:MAG: DUF6504 family protein [Actinomycetota bacterium]
MSRRYGEEVAMRAEAPDKAPSKFIWRGRIYTVLGVLGHWRETLAVTAGGSLRETAHEYYRLEVEAGTAGHRGVYDVRYDALKQTWILVRVWD